jgi:hypothetical protein
VIEGYDAPMPQGFWRRVLQYHVPPKWLACWLGLIVLELTFGVVCLPFWWLWTVLGWLHLAAGQLFGLQWLTAADPEWDTRLLRRDPHQYEVY